VPSKAAEAKLRQEHARNRLRSLIELNLSVAVRRQAEAFRGRQAEKRAATDSRGGDNNHPS
jgi:hypothetical protein